MSESFGEYQDKKQGTDALEEPSSKKRHRDQLEGETITLDSFKKTMLNANADDAEDSNKITFLRLGNKYFQFTLRV